MHTGLAKYTLTSSHHTAKNYKSSDQRTRWKGGFFLAKTPASASVREFSCLARLSTSAQPTQTCSSFAQQHTFVPAFSRTTQGARSLTPSSAMDSESQLANGLKGIKGFVFDKDGTLTDFYNTWMPLMRRASLLVASGDEQACLHLLETSGYISETGKCIPGSPIVAAPTDELANGWWNALLPEFAHLHARHNTLEEVTAIVEDVFLTGIGSTTQTVCDLPQFLGCLKDLGLKLGVATNDSEGSAFTTFDQFGATPYLDFVSGYDSGHGSKPGMILAFCAKTGLKPCEVAMVGDSVQDLVAGQKVGCGLRVGVLTGVALYDDLAPNAHMVIESIVKIQELLVPLIIDSKDLTMDDPTVPPFSVEYDSSFLSKRKGLGVQ